MPSRDRLEPEEPEEPEEPKKRRRDPAVEIFLPNTPPPAAVPAGLTIDDVDVAALGNPRSARDLLARWQDALRAWATSKGLTSRDLRQSGDWPTLADAEDAMGERVA